jgi:hypothetical protein
MYFALWAIFGLTVFVGPSGSGRRFLGFGNNGPASSIQLFPPWLTIHASTFGSPNSRLVKDRSIPRRPITDGPK